MKFISTPASFTPSEIETPYPYRLFAPGPVPVPEEMRQVLALPMIHHRSSAFQEILAESLELLKHVFQTQQPVMMMTSAGSGAMEAALVNTLSPGDRVLFVVSGKFGERWAQMGKTYGLDGHILEVEWGTPVSLQTFRETIQKIPRLKAVLTQVCETSTAVLHPIAELSTLLHQVHPQALFMVDAMTAIGATPVLMDEWKLDVVVAGSQKAFMLPAGLSFISLSEKAWNSYHESQLPKFYFDLGPERKANEGKETRFSSSVSLIRALHWVLKEKFAGVGLDRSISRCQTLARATTSLFSHFEWKIFSQSPSPSVTAAEIPPGLQDKKIPHLLLKKFNLFVAGGQDHLKNRIIRVGHLGDIKNEDQLFFAEAFGKVLDECHWPSAHFSQQQKALELTEQILKNA